MKFKAKNFLLNLLLMLSINYEFESIIDFTSPDVEILIYKPPFAWQLVNWNSYILDQALTLHNLVPQKNKAKTV